MSGPRRGAFIVIEGLDRSGKTTQTLMLHDRLISEGKLDAKLIKFPDRTTAIGKMIDSYLRSESELDDHAIHLLFSANRWEVASPIRDSLGSGTTIVCDRYAFSGIAFTLAKSLLSSASEMHKKLTYEWCRSPDVGLPAPDLTIFLDVSPEIAKLRGGYGSERYERDEHQQRVREVFAQVREDVQKMHGDGRWVTIDAGRDKHAVHEEIWNLVKQVIQTPEMPAISTLWSQN